MRDSPLYPVLYMVVLSAVLGAAVSAVAVATRDRVEAARQARFRTQVLSALGEAVPAEADALDAFWARSVEERPGPVYVLRRGGRVAGVAFPFRGPGFWGPIEGVVAVDPAGERLLGVAFTRHRETPGLGGRISEPWFREQFRGKRLAPGPDGRVLRFVLRRPAAPDEVEAITGATQTSTRLARFLNAFLLDLPGRAAAVSGGDG